ncbi:MAG TPA: hypothetical protein VGS19_18520 [Streptosporangiaceae bacterium]|nr:hypothetical protein [Streptosporangiaceae bacterium]
MTKLVQNVQRLLPGIPGRPWIAVCEVCLCEVGQHHGKVVPVALFLPLGDGLLVAIDGSRVVAEMTVDVAEGVQGRGMSDRVPVCAMER